MEEVKELTPTGKLKRPSYETVANWVKDLWNAVNVNLIRRSFKCCGISNNRDGSEDDWIFNYDRLGQADRLNDGVEIPSDKEDEEVQESEKDEESSEEEGEYHEKENDEEEDECEEEEDKCNENEDESEDDEFCGYYKQETNYVNVWDE